MIVSLPFESTRLVLLEVLECPWCGVSSTIGKTFTWSVFSITALLSGILPGWDCMGGWKKSAGGADVSSFTGGVWLLITLFVIFIEFISLVTPERPLSMVILENEVLVERFAGVPSIRKVRSWRKMWSNLYWRLWGRRPYRMIQRLRT